MAENQNSKPETIVKNPEVAQNDAPAADDQPKDNDQPPAVSIPDNGFQYQDKIYKVVLHAVIIPGLGKRTAAEITVDEEAQQYLVENKSSAIVEVV